jgi:hypothetical protein
MAQPEQSNMLRIITALLKEQKRANAMMEALLAANGVKLAEKKASPLIKGVFRKLVA